MPFFQTPPSLGNQFHEDRVLRSYLRRVVGEAPELTRELEALGALSGGDMYALQLADRENMPRLVQWDAWGNRVDRIEVTEVWKRARELAVQFGLVATAYEKKLGHLSRVAQFAKVYLFDPSSDVYSCPLAMTDGAAKTLSTHGQLPHAVAHLTSRDSAQAWTSGQWMTERTGGSDVSRTETTATKTADGWRLSGTKWFTSATTSEMALTLARPEGNPEGSRGLALFYVEREGNRILVNRLKDKLGTKKLPTAELTLDGALATPVLGLTDGVRAITPMLNVTRTWNAVCAAASMRRSMALCKDYAGKRRAFSAELAKKPLHLDTLAGMQAEAEAGFHFAMRLAELLGEEEAGGGNSELLRVLTPLCKLTTGKQTVALASEAVECFGGAGYVEDTGIPRILRDAQVLSIWEGTTNVLSLDALKTLVQSAAALIEDTARLTAPCGDSVLDGAGAHARATVASVLEELHGAPLEAEAQARRACLSLGRAYALALLVRQAAWEKSAVAKAAALRFACHGVNLMHALSPDASLLALS